MTRTEVADHHHQQQQQQQQQQQSPDQLWLIDENDVDESKVDRGEIAVFDSVSFHLWFSKRSMVITKTEISHKK